MWLCASNLKNVYWQIGTVWIMQNVDRQLICVCVFVSLSVFVCVCACACVCVCVYLRAFHLSGLRNTQSVMALYGQSPKWYPLLGRYSLQLRLGTQANPGGELNGFMRPNVTPQDCKLVVAYICLHTCGCVCVCLSVCVCACLCLCACVCVFVCVHVCLSVCMCVFVCVHVCMCLHLCVCLSEHPSPCLCLCAVMCVCVFVCVCVRVFISHHACSCSAIPCASLRLRSGNCGRIGEGLGNIGRRKDDVLLRW